MEDLADRIHRITGYLCDEKELRYIAGAQPNKHPETVVYETQQEKNLRLRKLTDDMPLNPKQGVLSSQKTEENWQPIDTIPEDREVMVKTISGLIRIAKRSKYGINGGKCHCWSRESESGSGDLYAVAWKPTN